MPDLIPISAVTNARTPTAATPTQGSGSELGKDAFMKLLVAQLKYQNPMEPTDPSQFMAQTAQFTMVEKLTQLADESALQRSMTEALTATSLLGRNVTWTDDAGTDHAGVVTGSSFGTAGPTLTIGAGSGAARIPLDQIRSVTTTA